MVCASLEKPYGGAKICGKKPLHVVTVIFSGVCPAQYAPSKANMELSHIYKM